MQCLNSKCNRLRRRASGARTGTGATPLPRAEIHENSQVLRLQRHWLSPIPGHEQESDDEEHRGKAIEQHQPD